MIMADERKRDRGISMVQAMCVLATCVAVMAVLLFAVP